VDLCEQSSPQVRETRRTVSGAAGLTVLLITSITVQQLALQPACSQEQWPAAVVQAWQVTH
jgi:hypothetical protein